MEPSHAIVFGPFRLVPPESTLWRGEVRVELQPRPLAVLCYLAQNPGRVVSREELLGAVWSGTFVSRTTVRVCVRTVREALGEDANAPRYIETVGREGYRFVGTHAEGSAAAPVLRGPAPRRAASRLVGREADLGRLQRWLARACDGERQVIFVTGEPGIGKTTVVEEFVRRLRAQGLGRVGRGQCLEQRGAGEAYLPVLEGIGRLCREPGGDRIVEVLRRHAPTWFAQVPALATEGDLEVLRRATAGATGERMLREMADALEVVTAVQPLVLVLEDLHWSDVSTLELIAYLAERRERARLLLVGTYRPTDAIIRDHPLRGIRQELQARGRCEALVLELLTRAEVAEYVASRLVEGAVSPELTDVIHDRTQGNPLFVVEVLEHLLDEGLVVERAGRWELATTVREIEDHVPESLRQLIQRQLERLAPEARSVLEVAAVVGDEFAAAAVAAGLKRDPETVDDECEELAWTGAFLQENGIAEWPDGTVSGCYRFRHVLYRNVLYERIGGARRVRLHRLIGARREAGYADRADEIAAELALHFEQAREYERTVEHLLRAADTAVRRGGHREAVGHFTRALDLLASLPDTPDRTQQEVLLRFRLALSLSASRGFAAPELEPVYRRLRELCRQLGDSQEVFLVLPPLRGFYFVRGDLEVAGELAAELLASAERVRDPFVLLWAHFGLGETLLYRGELARTREHLEQGIAYSDPRPYRATGAFRGVHDAGIACRSQLAMVLWHLGYPDQALARTDEAVALARESGDPSTLLFALTLAACQHQLRRDAAAVHLHATAVAALSAEHRSAYWLAWATILLGWCAAQRGQPEDGIAQMRRGLTQYEATGARICESINLALLAEAHRGRGETDAGLAALADALAGVEATQIRVWEAELHRLEGELLLAARPAKRAQPGRSRPAATEAERCFRRAIEIARRQGAKSWELRAATSLARLWHRQGRTKDARRVLGEVHGWFTEGFETADLKAAGEVLRGSG